MSDFQKLTVYQKAKRFNIDIKNLLREAGFDNFIKEELRRSSMDILLKIAESSSQSEKSGRVLSLSGSLSKTAHTLAIFDLLKENQEMDEFLYLDFSEKLHDIESLLESMIRKLNR